jgi:DNA-binding NtrC family response regulator
MTADLETPSKVKSYGQLCVPMRGDGPPGGDSTTLDQRVSSRQARTVRAPVLFVVMESGRPLVGGARHVLTDVSEIAIGRGESRTATRSRGAGLTLTFPSQYLSGKHARIVRTADGWVVEDLQSRNGTLVNGRLTTRALLEPGDVIDVGRVFLTLDEAPVDTSGDDDRDAADVSRERAGLLTLWPALEARLAELRRMAAQNVTVTLVGETGTGKEVMAEALHSLSARKGPYVAINCGAVPANLIESQLFGHVRGAFSGAAGPTPGTIRAADGGTLLLDEIVSTSPDVQVALLRVIQERQVTPVGTHQTIPVDVRFVAATQIPLRDAVARGTFRSDLQMRLEGYVFEIPALRERRSDLGILVASLLRRHGVTESSGATLTPQAALRVLRYHWPGNVRELEQALVRSWALAHDGEMDEAHLPDPESEDPQAVGAAAPADGDDRLRDELVEHLRVTKGNVAETSRRMGRARPLVHRWLKRLGIDPASYRR